MKIENLAESKVYFETLTVYFGVGAHHNSKVFKNVRVINEPHNLDDRLVFTFEVNPGEGRLVAKFHNDAICGYVARTNMAVDGEV